MEELFVFPLRLEGQVIVSYFVQLVVVGWVINWYGQENIIKSWPNYRTGYTNYEGSQVLHNNYFEGHIPHKTFADGTDLAIPLLLCTFYTSKKGRDFSLGSHN